MGINNKPPISIAKTGKAPFTASWILLLALLALPPMVKAQFTFTTNNGAITITGCSGPVSSVTNVIIPGTINGLPVTSIGNDAFQGYDSLTSVTISNGVSSIGMNAFQWCTSLTNVVIGNTVTSLNYMAFSYCLSLTSVTIPDSITSIGDYVFSICPSLTNLTIGNSVTSFGNSAFYDNNLSSVTIPASVTNIDYMAFGECRSMTALYFQGSAPAPGYAFFENSATVYYLPGTTEWGSTFGGLMTVQWNPLMQTSNGSFGVQSNQFGFNIIGSTNIPIVVEACTNLGSASWTPLQTCTLTNGSIYFTDPQWTNYPACLYRIRSP